MHRIGTYIALVTGVVACAAEVPPEVTSGSEAAVVGNTLANADHPEVVQLRLRDTPGSAEYTCTGTLLGKRTVITARHCVPPGPAPCLGRAVVDRTGKSASFGESFAVAACSIIEQGLVSTWTNDIALLRLAAPVNGILPARLGRSDPGLAAFTAYGYGAFGEALGTKCSQHSDGNKRTVDYRATIGVTFGQRVCPGDSGGPHFLSGTNLVYGLTSGGVAYLEASASVFRHVEEIERAIAANELDAR